MTAAPALTSDTAAAADDANADTITLRALLVVYAADRSIGKHRQQHFRAMLRWWRTHLLREAMVSDLTPDAITALYKFCFRQGCSRASVGKHREKIRCLVRYAADKNLIPSLFEIPAAIGRPAAKSKLRDKMVCLPPGTLPHYFRFEWLPTAGKSTSKGVIEEYESYLNHWLRFCDGRNMPMADVTTAMLDDFRQYLLKAGRSERIAYRAMIRLKGLLRHAEPEEWAPNYAHNKQPESDCVEGSLRAFFEDVYLPEHDMKDSTRRYYGYTIAIFRRHLGREPMLTDLTDKTVNNFLSAIAGQYEPPSLKGYRNSLVGLWRSAFEWELTDIQPRRVRRIKVPPPQPDAWKPEEAVRLIEAADKLTGNAAGIPRSLLLRAWMLAQYDTGLRTIDMLGLRREAIDWQTGVVVVRQQKTGFPIPRRFAPATLEAIQATLSHKPDRERVFPLSKGHSRGRLYRAWRELLELADLPVHRRNGPQKWRRTSATHLARAAGMEAATEHLGHRSAELARKYYLDASQAFAPPPLPPPLPVRQPVAGLLEGPKSNPKNGELDA